MHHLIALVALATGTALGAQVVHRTVTLTGDQEVPPVATSADGWGIVRLNTATGQVDAFVRTFGAPTATAAHIHNGAAGVNGPVVIPLSAGGPGEWTGSGTLTPAQVAALTSGNNYVNVHTPANPGGEIRGQIVEPSTTRLVASLDGAQEVPPVATAATGELEMFLFQPDNILAWTMSTTGMTPTAGHLHRGVTGTNGPIVVNMGPGPGPWCGVSDRLSEADVATLLSGGIYTNVHSAAVSTGEIRGQVRRAVDFNFGLNGAESPSGSTNFGRAHIVRNLDDSLTYEVEVTGFSATVAHIHVAPPGVNGPVVFPLTGGPTVFAGTTPPLTAAELADLNAGNYYVNVHSAAFPGGEVRGQILLDGGDHPTVFGHGCDGPSGEPRIGGQGPAIAGFDVTVDLYQGTPSTLAAMLLGFDRDRGAIGRLPQELSGVGLPTCYQLHDNTGLAPLAVTDSNGCASVTLGVPGNLALLGLEAYGQWAVLAPGANPVGAVLSNGIVLRVR